MASASVLYIAGLRTEWAKGLLRVRLIGWSGALLGVAYRPVAVEAESDAEESSEGAAKIWLNLQLRFYWDANSPDNQNKAILSSYDRFGRGNTL